jgi:very-short-patch-repair endonuclease
VNDEITISSVNISKMIGTKNTYILRDIRNYILKISNIKIAIVDDYFIESTYVNSQNKVQPCYLATLKGVKFILDNKRKHKNIYPLLQWYNKNKESDSDIIILQDRKEIEFINKLEQSLIPFSMNGIRQYQVLTYRIDYYIPKLNIAMEYDEDEHKNYTYEKQKGRQIEIEKELGCRFIRVSDKNSDEHNIGLVFKELFRIAS